MGINYNKLRTIQKYIVKNNWDLAIKRDSMS